MTCRCKRARAQLDLKLAESYIPAVVTMGKGILYTCVVFATKFHDKYQIMICIAPGLVLYYDHLFLAHISCLSFLDSSSIATDVFAATLLTQVAHTDTWHQHSVIIAAVWTVVGLVHIWVGILPRVAVYMVTCISVLSLVMFSGQASDSVGWVANFAPAFLRSVLYILLVIIDAYTLRPPSIRELDRMGMAKYGIVLFVYWPVAIVCTVLLLCMQCVKLYLDNHDGGEYIESVIHHRQDMSYDNMDICEAFRLAKQQIGSKAV